MENNKTEIIALPEDFSSKIASRMVDFNYRFHHLVEFAISNKNLTTHYDKIRKKINPSKEEDFYTQVRGIYKLLECFHVFIPDYNESWFLFGEGDMFNKNDNSTIVQTENSIIKRLQEFITYTIRNYKNPFFYNFPKDNVKQRHFIEFIYILRIHYYKDREFILRSYFDPEFDPDDRYNESEINKMKKEYKYDDKTIYDLIEEIHNLFITINKLKEIIPDFNESWLLLGEGDMFEKTEN